MFTPKWLSLLHFNFLSISGNITTLQNISNAATAAKSPQSCPTLCDPIDGSPSGSPVPGILQANTGVGCHFLLQCRKVKSESEVAQSCPTLATPWTAAYQAPPSMGFSRQEYWSDLPLVRGFYYQPVAGILGSACRGCPCKGAREAGLCRRRSWIARSCNRGFSCHHRDLQRRDGQSEMSWIEDWAPSMAYSSWGQAIIWSEAIAWVQSQL